MKLNFNDFNKIIKRLCLLIFLLVLSPITLNIAFKAINLHKNNYPDKYFAYALLFIAALLLVYTIYFAIKYFKDLLKVLFDNF